MTEEMMLVGRRVGEELDRQCELKAAGKFKYTCADEACPRGLKLAILMEEVGEVAREICEDGLIPDAQYRLREELIQVAAVAAAWASSLPERKQLDLFSKPPAPKAPLTPPGRPDMLRAFL